ncbi:MAG TPA: Hpt domain-containing protein [Candidatus Binataceae bacterium]|nr:Hpt domain-containing protein [Candidatus Binataceae bacterium]
MQILDAEVIADLRSEGDELLEDLIALFVSETPKRLATLAGSADAGNCAEAERAAHTLKSSAATLGAQVLSATAAAMEDAARGRRLEDVARLLGPLEAEANRVIAALCEESARGSRV